MTRCTLQRIDQIDVSIEAIKDKLKTAKLVVLAVHTKTKDTLITIKGIWLALIRP